MKEEMNIDNINEKNEHNNNLLNNESNKKIENIQLNTILNKKDNN